MSRRTSSYGRRVALLTIVAFGLLLVTLAAPHTLGQGVGK